jgi:putative tryptophan/tyrosine transport system substrate-binding protein
MLTRRNLLAGSLVAVSLARASEAQQLPRIGVLSPSSARDSVPFSELFRRSLRERGWIDGQTVLIEWRWANGELARLAALAAELVRLEVKVIYATTGRAALAAVRATQRIPIVAMAGDAIGQQLTSSLARPDRNVTGFSLISPETAAKRLQLLKAAVPRATRVAVLRCPAAPTRWGEWPATQEAARALKIELVPFEVRDDKELRALFDTAHRQRADALVIFDCALFATFPAARFVDHTLPTIYPLDRYVAAGGLLVYAPDSGEITTKGTGYVDKILRGAKPSQLPVEQPTKFRFVVNLKTAKTLGLTIPRELLWRADHVIQ